MIIISLPTLLFYVCFFAGFIFQFRLLSFSWRGILIACAGSMSAVLLMTVFWSCLTSKCSLYVATEQLLLYFFSILIIWVLIKYEEKIIYQFHEGLTLGHVIVAIYALLASSLRDTTEGLVFFMGVVLLGLFVCYHAFTQHPLTKKHRFGLSIISSSILFIFSFIYCFDFYQEFQVMHLLELNMQLLLLFMLRSFLLGFSIVYLWHNGMMVLNFFPRGSDFLAWADYQQDVRDLYKDHIRRYSMQQITIRESVALLLFFVSLCTMNFWFEFLPVFTCIWLLFFLYPFYVRFLKKANIL